MTFFAPLLLYVLVVRGSVRWAWLVWAILAGFRPSDGVFLLPLMLYASARRARARRPDRDGHGRPGVRALVRADRGALRRTASSAFGGQPAIGTTAFRTAGTRLYSEGPEQSAALCFRKRKRVEPAAAVRGDRATGERIESSGYAWRGWRRRSCSSPFISFRTACTWHFW